MAKSKNKLKENLIKIYQSNSNITPIGKRNIHDREIISNFLKRQFMNYYESEQIEDNNNNEFSIKKINYIQYWWKTIHKIILLQKNIIVYLYRIKVQKKKKDMNLHILSICNCIIKIFYRYLVNNLKKINDKEKQYIKLNYYNKWIEINNKKLIIEKLINKQKKICNKNLIIHKSKTNILKEDNVKKYNKTKALKANGIFYKNQTFKINKKSNNQSFNTISTTLSNNSLNKKLLLIKSQNKNSYTYMEKNKHNSLLPDPSYSKSTLNPNNLNNKKLSKNCTNKILLSNRNNSSKQLFKKPQYSPNKKNLSNKTKVINKTITNFIVHKNNLKNAIINKSNELKIKNHITNNDNSKLTILNNNLHNGISNITNSLNNTKIQNGKNNDINVHNQKFLSTDLNKNIRINKKSYKKIYDSNSIIARKNNSKKKFFIEWYSKTNKKNILANLIYFHKSEKIKKYFISMQWKLLKYVLIKIIKKLTLSYYFKKYQNISKTLSTKKNIIKNLIIHCIQKQRENHIKTQQNNYNNIGVINNININNYINYTDNTINNEKLSKIRTNSKNIICKSINLNKINSINNHDSIHGVNNKLIHPKLKSLNLEYSINNIKDNNEIAKQKFINNIAQINQLKMVFNLIENRYLLNKKINNKKFNAFKKWRNLSFVYKNKITPKINEKIILLKSPQLSNISNNLVENSGSFLSLRESNLTNYNILDYTNNNHRITNNIYVNYGNEKKNKNKNHNVIKSFQSLLQENINNVSLTNNNMVYHKKKLCLSNNKINYLGKSNKKNNASVFCDPFNETFNYFNYNTNNFTITKDFTNNKLINHLKNDRYSIYNQGGYNNDTYNMSIYNRNSLNTERNFDDICAIKKINKIEEKEIFFGHKKNNNNADSNNSSSNSSNYDFKVCVTEHYNKNNGGNIDEEYSRTEFY